MAENRPPLPAFVPDTIFVLERRILHNITANCRSRDGGAQAAAQDNSIAEKTGKLRELMNTFFTRAEKHVSPAGICYYVEILEILVRVCGSVEEYEEEEEEKEKGESGGKMQQRLEPGYETLCLVHGKIQQAEAIISKLQLRGVAYPHKCEFQKCPVIKETTTSESVECSRLMQMLKEAYERD